MTYYRYDRESGQYKQIQNHELKKLESDIRFNATENAEDPLSPWMPFDRFDFPYWNYIMLQNQAHTVASSENEQKLKTGILLIIICMGLEYTDNLSGSNSLLSREKSIQVKDILEKTEFKNERLDDLRQVALQVIGACVDMIEKDFDTSQEYDHAGLQYVYSRIDFIKECFNYTYSD